MIGPGIGRDAAAIRVGNRVIVVKTDPITFATNDAGRYLVNVNANDIACMGAKPRWLLVTALLPECSTTPDLVEEIFSSLATASTELGIILVGGHTEITIGLDRPILVGQMIGEADEQRLLDLRAAQPGDSIVLCSGIAIEGTAILAREACDALAQVGEDIVRRASQLLVNPGISVLPAVSALRDGGVPVRGFHDPTEGGIATAISELASASGLGASIDLDAIPILEETLAICGALELNPLGLIASGSLLAVVPHEAAGHAMNVLREAGIPAAEIGTMLGPEDTLAASNAGIAVPFPTFDVDEIARYLSTRQ